MSRLHKNLHPNLDRDFLRQQALTRYKYLRSFKKSELSLDERLFLDNFEAAMLYMWDVKKTTTS
jgi:hypothetical protein